MAGASTNRPTPRRRRRRPLNRDDPRRMDARNGISAEPLARRRVQLRKLIEVGHTAIDRQHTRLRSFRNIVVMTAILIGVLVLAFIGIVALDPTSVPLCFEPMERTAGVPRLQARTLCSRRRRGRAAGFVGRSPGGRRVDPELEGHVDPLRHSGGAGVAQGHGRRPDGHRGDHRDSRSFIPGLSELDSQEQILAYALVFGYAQQVLTRSIDRRAAELLDAVPSKNADSTRPPPVALPEQPPDAWAAQNGHTATKDAVGSG